MMFVPSPISMLIFFSPQALLVFAIKKKRSIACVSNNQQIPCERTLLIVFFFQVN
jgi:hypothetical protein